MYMRQTLLFLAALVGGLLHGQPPTTDTLLVFGTVKELSGRDPLRAFTVQAVDVADTTHRLVARINSNGTYELHLHEVRNYLITYSATGLMAKRVRVEMGETRSAKPGGFGMNIDISLPKAGSGHTAELYKEPMGIARFDAVSARYAWDTAYERATRDRVKRATGR
jgi:hypothetical protein